MVRNTHEAKLGAPAQPCKDTVMLTIFCETLHVANCKILIEHGC